tara:strand:+ start:699 stop:926 length:228 start_codon:yes stop_codon:yes gene_type:complete
LPAVLDKFVFRKTTLDHLKREGSFPQVLQICTNMVVLVSSYIGMWSNGGIQKEIEEFSQTLDYGLNDISKLDNFN